MPVSVHLEFQLFQDSHPASVLVLQSQGCKKATQPCPCGYHNHPEKDCVCAPGVVQKYLNRISGPLLDRIDIHVEVTPVPINELAEERRGEKSESVRERVIKARNVQTKRFEESKGVHCNAQMTSRLLKEICVLDEPSKDLLKKATDRLGLSARAFDRILKVSRTIADLEGSDVLKSNHLAEAIQYRSLDRDSWAG